MYRLISSVLGILLHCKACIVGYPVYPYSTIAEHACSIYESIKYMKDNEKAIFKYDNLIHFMSSF